jgi:hypothetical protein
MSGGVAKGQKKLEVVPACQSYGAMAMAMAMAMEMEMEMAMETEMARERFRGEKDGILERTGCLRLHPS